LTKEADGAASVAAALDGDGAAATEAVALLATVSTSGSASEDGVSGAVERRAGEEGRVATDADGPDSERADPGES
jgi:hypothetical protein